MDSCENSNAKEAIYTQNPVTGVNERYRDFSPIILLRYRQVYSLH